MPWWRKGNPPRRPRAVNLEEGLERKIGLEARAHDRMTVLESFAWAPSAGIPMRIHLEIPCGLQADVEAALLRHVPQRPTDASSLMTSGGAAHAPRLHGGKL